MLACCRHCQHQVYVAVKLCPACGGPSPAPFLILWKWRLRRLAVVVPLIGIAVFVAWQVWLGEQWRPIIDRFGWTGVAAFTALLVLGSAFAGTGGRQQKP
jgi:apolipoprotein N-acyltransferase